MSEEKTKILDTLMFLLDKVEKGEATTVEVQALTIVADLFKYYFGHSEMCL